MVSLSDGLDVVHFLAETALRATILMALAVLVIAAIRRRSSAAFRHRLYLLTLGGVLLMPVFALVLRPYQATLPRPQFAIARPAPMLPAVVVPPSAAGAVPTTPGVLPNPVATAARITPVASLPPAITWVGLLFLLYVAGVFVVTMRTAVGLIGLWRLCKHCPPVLADTPIDLEATAAFRAMGVRRRVTICVAGVNAAAVASPIVNAAAVASPMTWGTLRPIVALPTDATGWPTERLRAALLHEAAHIRRGDFLTRTLFARSVVALYWFHPLVWFVARQLRVESERACDDLVLTIGQMPGTEYAQHLLDIARSARGSFLRATGGVAVSMAQTASIEGRLRAVLNSRLNRREANRRVRALSLVGAACLVAVACLFRFAAPVAAVALGVGSNTSATNKSTDQTIDVVELPNGATLQIAAVLDRAAGKRDIWWKADGTPLAHGPFPRDNAFPEIVSGRKWRAIVMQFNFATKDQPRLDWTPPPLDGQSFAVWGLFPYRKMDAPPYAFTPTAGLLDNAKPFYSVNNIRILDQRDDTQTLRSQHTKLELDSLSVPDTAKRVDITMQVAAGPWTRIVDCPKQVGDSYISTDEGKIRFNLDPHSNITSYGSKEVYARLEASVFPPHYVWPMPNMDGRLVALDRNGKIVSLVDGGTNSSGFFPARLLPKVAKFRWLRRPYEKVTLRNIALEPIDGKSRTPDSRSPATTTTAPRNASGSESSDRSSARRR